VVPTSQPNAQPTTIPISGFPNGCAAHFQLAYSLTTIPLIRQQNGRGMAPLQ
jgi:hypothetical protein